MTELPRQSNTDRALASGIAWTAVMKWSSQLISWAATLYAARTLSPGDFGLIGMAMLAIGFARMVQEFGLDAILVQDRTIVGERRSQLASLLILVGVLLCVGYAALAALIAGFFGEPQVAGLVMALGTIFVLDSVQIVPYAQLQRDLQFRRLALIAFVQVCTASAVLVTATTLDLGVWALVVNNIAGEIVVTILLLAWAPYSISWSKNTAQLLQPLLQGWRMLVARFAWYAYTNADRLLIGRVLGKDLLGSYSMAQTFSTLAQQEIGSILSRVVPGIFSEVQQQRAELRRYFLLLTEIMTVASFPVAIGMALVADIAIPFVLGDQWDAVVTPLRWLCLYAVFTSAQLLVPHVLLWTGQFRVNMWCSILAGLTIPLVLFLVVGHGLRGIAMSWALVFPVVSLPAFYFAFRTLDMKVAQWLGALWPALLGSAIMAAVVIACRALLPDGTSMSVRVGTTISTGVVAYVATVMLLFGSRWRVWLALLVTIRSR